MSATLDELLAEPVDLERHRVRSLPAVLYGVALPVGTACGIVSRSAEQTAGAVARARAELRHDPDRSALTDTDLVWLLLMGWAPEWRSWMT